MLKIILILNLASLKEYCTVQLVRIKVEYSRGIFFEIYWKMQFNKIQYNCITPVILYIPRIMSCEFFLKNKSFFYDYYTDVWNKHCDFVEAFILILSFHDYYVHPFIIRQSSRVYVLSLMFLKCFTDDIELICDPCDLPRVRELSRKRNARLSMD